jgi:hypothetical protein
MYCKTVLGNVSLAQQLPQPRPWHAFGRTGWGWGGGRRIAYIQNPSGCISLGTRGRRRRAAYIQSGQCDNTLAGCCADIGNATRSAAHAGGWAHGDLLVADGTGSAQVGGQGLTTEEMSVAREASHTGHRTACACTYIYVPKLAVKSESPTEVENEQWRSHLRRCCSTQNFK